MHPYRFFNIQWQQINTPRQTNVAEQNMKMLQSKTEHIIEHNTFKKELKARNRPDTKRWRPAGHVRSRDCLFKISWQPPIQR